MPSDLVSKLDFMELLIIVLIGLLFFKEHILVWISTFLNHGVSKKEVTHPTPKWALDLQEHYNHETTEQLTEIINTQEKVLDLMREHNKLDERVIHLLENFKEYGIPCQKQS